MKIIAFDIETGDAETLFQPRPDGSNFVRLCGWTDVYGDVKADGSVTVHQSTNPVDLVNVLKTADQITAHNGLNYDLMALAVHGYISFDGYRLLAAKTVDTLLVERHLEPVAARGMQTAGFYTLGECAGRYGLDGKDTVDFAGKLKIVRRISGDKVADRMLKARERSELKAMASGASYNPVDSFGVLKLLAELYGGFDQIAQDDPDYRRYLDKDVRAQRGLFLAHNERVEDLSSGSQQYLWDEHATAANMARVTMEGCCVDTDLNGQRLSEGQQRLEAGKALMVERYGMPDKGKKPHITGAGKAAFRRALIGTGISEEALEANWPTNKDGSLAMSKDVLSGMIEILDQTKPDAAELCRTILAMNGERTVYGTIADKQTLDRERDSDPVSGGVVRVHPSISPDQASGRWSMKNPGLTVLGKRGGKARERAVILADSPDDVLVAIDADQVDARVIAAECQDPEYMKLFAPGMDLHSEVAFRVWSDMARHGENCHQLDEWFDHGCGVKNKCHCVLRDQAKVFGHGFSYGLGANGMAMQHGVDVDVAKSFIWGMTDAFPRLAEWKAEVRAAAGVLGFDERAPEDDSYRILHTWAGRPVRVERERAYTQATALIGQGGTRDVMAKAIRQMDPFYRRRVRAVIHDEVLVSIPRDNAEARAKALADGMAFDLKGVAITFGVSELGDCWAGCYGEQYCPHGQAAA